MPQLPHTVLPPVWADRMLRFICPEELHEELLGDLHEQFEHQVAELGEPTARRLYIEQTIRFCRPYFIARRLRGHSKHRSTYSSPLFLDPHMIRNYFKIAWRTILKHKTFSLLNLFGLALSMSAGFLILLLYQDGYNYDKFHKDAELIYRVNTIATRKNGEIEPYATSPKPIGKVIESTFTWVETVTVLKPFDDVIIKNNQRFDFQGKVTDENFLNIFSFSLQSGDAAHALKEPNSIILTSKLSERLFGSKNPINSTIQLGNRDIYKITGILGPNPGKTHFEFDALLSEKSSEDTVDNWANINAAYTYLKVRPKTNAEQAIRAINKYALPNYKNLAIDNRDAHYKFDLQALPDITPGYSIANAMGKGLPSHLLWFLALMGFIVIVSAIFNYSNLTLAKTFSRAKEIGVRKVMGANRSQVLFQIISEGIILALIALIIAIGFVMYFKAELSALQSFQFFDLNVSPTLSSFAYFIIFAILMGAMAGLLPAITISKLNPLRAIQKIENLAMFKRIGLVKILLVVQFAFTMLFLMIITTLHKQIEFAINMDYGFSADQVYSIRLQGIPVEIVRSKFAGIAGVERISSMDIPIGTYSNASAKMKIHETDEYKSVSSYSVDNEFIPGLGLTLISGTNFSSNPSLNTTNKEVIVNELFTEKYQLGNAAESIGKQIFLNDSTTATIKGVVKDFLFKPADDPLKPLLLRNEPSEWKMLNVKIAPHSTEKTVAALQSAWKELAPGYAFRGEFYKTTIETNFAIGKDVNKIITFFTFLSAVIGIMGLLGMTIYSVEKRQREISLRKVLGATKRDIIITLSKGFVLLLLISFCVAIPLGVYVSDLILTNFANRISAGLNIVLPGFILISLLAVITVCSQTIRAALMNPVKSLRSE
ncbi:FtsX-like permease family protein [Dyadobacter sp. OTU695]|uniref:FtsX-like permease family protein n=1 Tax=Dyadobacter sp. OTU695 TaxID=3043860 RepID=UPI00313DC5A3